MQKISIFSLVVCISLVVACTPQTTIGAAEANYQQSNYSAAFAQLTELADAGDAEAQYALGYMYYYGKGTARDPDIARSWIRKAAKQNYQPAQQALHQLINNTGRSLSNHQPFEANLSPQQRDLNWMRSQAPTAYTVSIAENSQSKQLRQLSKILNKSGQTAQYRYKQSGKLMHGLSYGTYISETAAKQARQQLPAELQKSAVVRRWDSIQKVMLP